MKSFEVAAAGSTHVNDSRNGHGDAAAKIGRSVAYMAEHLNQPLHVAALAAQAKISTSHYFALFKRQTGCAPIGYFIRLRMERARQLLESTSSSVKEIAGVLGYHDPFYFSRLFKSVNRVAPSQYRALRKGVVNGEGVRAGPDAGFAGRWVSTDQAISTGLSNHV